MRRLCIPCLFFFIFISGCASLQAKRDVIGDYFYSSSNPEIKIKVNPELKYIGEVKDVKQKQAQDSTYLVTVRSYFYIFIASDGSRATKALTISISKVSTYYVPDIYGRVEKYYDKGVRKLGKHAFQYVSRQLYLSPAYASTKFVAEKGYVVPNCVVSTSFSKIFGAKGNILLTVTYLEDISSLPYKCKAWKSGSYLLEDQREFLKQFNKNCDMSFTIIE